MGAEFRIELVEDVTPQALAAQQAAATAASGTVPAQPSPPVPAAPPSLPLVAEPPPLPPPAPPALPLVATPNEVTVPPEPTPISGPDNIILRQLPAQEPILAEAREALVALGTKKRAADAMIEQLMASGQSFMDVGEVVAAAFKKPAASPIPPVQPPPNEPPSAVMPPTPAAAPPAPPVQPPLPPMPPREPPMAEMEGIPIPLSTVITNWPDSLVSKGNRSSTDLVQPPATSRTPAAPTPPRGQKQSGGNYLGVIQDYLVGTLRAELHPLARMLGDKAGVFGGKASSAGGSGAGMSTSGFFASGNPQPVFVTNWPGTASGAAGPTTTVPGAPPTSQPPPGAAGPTTTVPGAPGGADSQIENEVGSEEVAGVNLAAVMGALVLVEKSYVGAVDIARVGIRQLGETAVDVAKNDLEGVLVGGLNASEEALRKIPLAGEALGATFGLIAEPVKQATNVMNAFVDRGKQLQGFSGELTGANALADVRSMMADIREANALGPDLAKLTEAQSELSNDVRDMLLPIKQAVIGLLTDVLRMIQDTLPYIKAMPDVFHHIAYGLAEIIKDAILASKEDVGRDLQIMANQIAADFRTELERARLKAKNPESALLDTQLRLLRQNRPMERNPNDPLADAAPGALNIPAVFAGGL
jgi:RuvA, C-terminal domain